VRKAPEGTAKPLRETRKAPGEVWNHAFGTGAYPIVDDEGRRGISLMAERLVKRLGPKNALSFVPEAEQTSVGTVTPRSSSEDASIRMRTNWALF